MSEKFSLVRVRRVQHLRPLEGAVAAAVATAILAACVPFVPEVLWIVIMMCVTACAVATGAQLRAALACALLAQWARREDKFAVVVGGASKKELALTPDTIAVEPSQPATGDHVLPKLAAGALVDEGPGQLVVLIPDGRASVRVLRFDVALKALARGDAAPLRELEELLQTEHAHWSGKRPRLPAP